MRTEKLSDAKNNLSRLVEQVRQGERIRILVHGVAVADLVPVSEEAGASATLGLRMAELQKLNIVRPRLTPLPAALFDPGPSGPGRPLSQYLDEDREDRL